MRRLGARSLLVAAIIALAFASSLVIIAGCTWVDPAAGTLSHRTEPFLSVLPAGDHWADPSAAGAVRG